MIRISPRDISHLKADSSFSFEIDSIAPDKSISHRSAMFALLSDKPSIIRNYLQAEDTLSTLSIAKALGLQVESIDKDTLKLTPPKQFSEPNCVLDCGNAGTAMRLYVGLLAGLAGSVKMPKEFRASNDINNDISDNISNASDGFYCVLSGDKYLCARPMNRVITPLKNIGAHIFSRQNGLAPLSIISTQLDGFIYESKIASAQVKSAMILAALHGKDKSTYIEPSLTRPHTESMLLGMNAPIKIENIDSTSSHCSPQIRGRKIGISPLTKALEPLDFAVPCDPSSAFYFAIAAAITPNSEILLKNVALNPTRIEAYKILEKMGAKVRYENITTKYEEVGDIYVASGNLEGIKVEENIAWLIDELPALSIAMALANGVSEVRNAKELRVKESDRIKAVLENLATLGVGYEEREDGYVIYGGGFFSHNHSKNLATPKAQNLSTDSKIPQIKSFGDHRIAMSFAIAGIITPLEIDDESCINISFPNFLEILSKIAKIN